MTTSSSEGEMALASDAVLEAVADEHRRAVLRALQEAEDGTLTIGALVERVATSVPRGERSTEERRRRIRTMLHHHHLPKLEACGLIERDAAAGTVADGNRALGRDLLDAVERKG